MNRKDNIDDKDRAAAPGKGAPSGGKSDEEHGNNSVTVTVDQVEKVVHRGSYSLEQLKAALGVAPGRELDIIEKGVLRTVASDERVTVKDGMEFVSRQPAGGAS